MSLTSLFFIIVSLCVLFVLNYIFVNAYRKYKINYFQNLINNNPKVNDFIYNKEKSCFLLNEGFCLSFINYIPGFISTYVDSDVDNLNYSLNDSASDSIVYSEIDDRYVIMRTMFIDSINKEKLLPFKLNRYILLHALIFNQIYFQNEKERKEKQSVEIKRVEKARLKEIEKKRKQNEIEKTIDLPNWK